MLRDKTEAGQQPQAPHHGGLLSETSADLEAFFPHHHQSSAPNIRMEQHEAVTTTAGEDLPDVPGEDFGHQPQAQQQSRPAAATQPGQRTVPGRRPLFRR